MLLSLSLSLSLSLALLMIENLCLSIWNIQLFPLLSTPQSSQDLSELGAATEKQIWLSRCRCQFSEYFTFNKFYFNFLSTFNNS